MAFTLLTSITHMNFIGLLHKGKLVATDDTMDDGERCMTKTMMPQGSRRLDSTEHRLV
jgi:hypothetical protein